MDENEKNKIILHKGAKEETPLAEEAPKKKATKSSSTKEEGETTLPKTSDATPKASTTSTKKRVVAKVKVSAKPGTKKASDAKSSVTATDAPKATKASSKKEKETSSTTAEDKKAIPTATDDSSDVATTTEQSSSSTSVSEKNSTEAVSATVSADTNNEATTSEAPKRNYIDNITSSKKLQEQKKENLKRRAESLQTKEGGAPKTYRHKTFSGQGFEGRSTTGERFGARRPFPAREGEGGRPFIRRDGTAGRPGFEPRFPKDGERGSFNRGGAPTGQRQVGFRLPARRGENLPPPTDNSREEGKKHLNSRLFKYKKKEDVKEFEAEQEFTLYEKKSIQKVNPVPKEIDILDVITVSELARKMNLKAADLISKLFSMGVMATINDQIDADTATILASEFDCKVNLVSLYDETIIETEEDSEDSLQPRPPIITVMGHVDHGKTKTLDAIRSTNVVANEHGGITQHIGAYKIEKNGHQLVFLDTPGHAAFSLMRARGAQVTDMVVLVVAANDGVMPQTIEAINHAKEANVPIIVAVNKCDLQEANVDRVKQQLSEYDLIPEDWGGSTLYCEISALKKIGIDALLDTIILQAEMMELKANYNTRAEGKVIESRVEQGRGIVSTIIVQRGTLKIGDAYVAGVYYGKIRALFNDKGESVKIATPSTPVEITGLTGIPDAGAPFQVTSTEKEAKQVAIKRQELDKQTEAKNIKKITLDNLYSTIQDGSVQELKVVVKGDVHGSVEAVKSALEKLGNEEIRIKVIHSCAGAILESDVSLASASNAIIIGFNVRPTPKTQELADKEKVEIRKYNIIYDVIEDMNDALEGMLSPDYQEETVGLIEVRETFKVPKVGTIAGCYVTQGHIDRSCKVHLLRDSIVIFTGSISSLKRFKDDVKEVKEGYECGIGIADFNDIQIGDQLEVFVLKEVRKKLEK